MDYCNNTSHIASYPQPKKNRPCPRRTTRWDCTDSVSGQTTNEYVESTIPFFHSPLDIIMLHSMGCHAICVTSLSSYGLHIVESVENILTNDRATPRQSPISTDSDCQCYLSTPCLGHTGSWCVAGFGICRTLWLCRVLSTEHLQSL